MAKRLIAILILGLTTTFALSQQPDPKESAPKKPAADKPAADKPATDKPAADTPAVEKDPKENDPKPKVAVADLKTFAEVNQRFDELSKELDALGEKHGLAGVLERAKIVEQFKTTVQQQKDLLPRMRELALAEYQQAPNENELISKRLLGLMANDLRQDRYTDALEIGRLLTKHDCPLAGLAAQLGMAQYCTDDFAAAKVNLQKAKDAKQINGQASNYLTDVDEAIKLWAAEAKVRDAEAKADDLPRVKLETNRGAVVIELYENEAPQAVANFISLVEKKFYDGLTFHRVLPGFMAQGGCPEGSGRGGPGYYIPCECYEDNYRKHFRGSISMAHAGRDTGGSQFFLTFLRTPHLDGKHTVFGRVIEGLDVLADLQRRNPSQFGRRLPDPDKIVTATVVRKRNHEYAPKTLPEEK